MTEQELDALERPVQSLLTYYFLRSLILGPLFVIPMIPLFFRYHTLRYRFDHEGISMRWGILFRKEIHLTYSRIQDIHLVSNVVERWLGLARIQVQTASGSAKAEMTIEGIPQFEQLRDHIYAKMRGSKQAAAGSAAPPAAPAATAAPGELTAVLRDVAGELRRIRELMEPPS